MMKDHYKEKVRELVEKMFKVYHLNYSKVAQQMGEDGRQMSRQSLWKMVNNGSLKLSTFLEMLDVSGIEMNLSLEKTDKRLRSGNGSRIVQDIDGVTYDTWKCTALSSSFYADGENKYSNHLADELYADLSTSTFLLAHYCDSEYAETDEGKKYPWMEKIDSDQRFEFVKKYGVL